MAVNRLDQPREIRRTIRPHYDPEAFGRLSEQIARFLGTARFLVYMTGFIAVWVLWNALAPGNLAFDPYPFIFLTLILSLQASYAAPLILLAQNRQADRDRVQGEQDRLAGERNQAEVEYLTREIAGLRLALGELATRDYIRGELEHLREDILQSPARPDGAGGAQRE
ncbi:DUF1003 domain-containing protein [Sphaerisporangium rhizosphaerae]|uniref:DUF1003 domain-containing protein n=1 Tax=Sphaerisporangium rhizosphaerae TaxID=2269375 RepID=A0ABW2PA15_9ACTN